jgi:hypothetical protein
MQRLDPIVSALGTRTAIAVLLGAFWGTQTWIIRTLATTGPVGRAVLEQWTKEDVTRFQRHYRLDFWIHPAIYGLLLSSLIAYDLRRRKHPQWIYYSTLFSGIVVAGAACDVVENSLHSSIRFHPLVAPDHVLFAACAFAMTKWIIVLAAVSALVGRYFMVPVVAE